MSNEGASSEGTGCVACGSTSWDFRFDASDAHYRNKGSWRIVQCTECALVRQDPVPSGDELAAFYPNDYYSFSHESRSASPTGQLLRRFLYPQGMREDWTLTPGRMIDLGCGDGWVLDQYSERGWTALGVEPSERAAEAGRSQGREILAGAIEAQQLEPATFDLVRSNHSFEHIPNPGDVLDAVARALKPGGRLVIGVPNTKSLAFRLFRSKWYYLGAPVHTYGYNPSNLTMLLRRHGFEVKRVRYNSDDSGLLGSVQVWLNRTSGIPALEGRLMLSLPLRFAAFWMAKAIDLVRWGDCIELTCVRTGQ
jgi:SAM-dependent methyltransferase